MRGVLPDVTMTKVPSVSAVNPLGAVVSDSRGSAADERAGGSKPSRRTVPTKVDPSRKGNPRGPPDSCFPSSRSRADQKEVDPVRWCREAAGLVVHGPAGWAMARVVGVDSGSTSSFEMRT